MQLTPLSAGKWRIVKAATRHTRERESALMNKCDKCQNMARVTVSGYLVARYLCALHASELCESVGDQAGAVKFAQLIAGDRLSA
jgi:hypothetical protein